MKNHIFIKLTGYSNLKETVYELFARKAFRCLIHKLLLFTFFNSNGREFHNTIPSYVKKFPFKFVDTTGRENLQAKIALYYAYGSFLLA